ncbi:T9SS type A sorting domain-containing protein, partial [candidate division KSB1 bacterium]|nr:T9SS type A sorting domain-containing protein [candidate division KSB1 bacterium]
SEPGFDYCYLDVSSDGGTTWTNLDVWDEENDPRVWYDETYNLTDYATATTIVRWRMESDGGYESPDSWRIDDILITDGTTQFLFDDGGDTAAELVPVDHPIAWARMHYDYDDGRLGASWFVVDPLTIFNGSLDLRDYAGMTTRFQLHVTSDGWNRLGEAPGYGYYFDDVRVYGQGVAQIDGAIVDVGGLFMAAPGKPVNAVVYMANEGIQDLNGPILWYGSIKDEAGNELAKPVGKFDGTLAQGEVAAVPTLGPTQWIPMKPGNYTFEVTQLQVNQDGWPVNNSTDPIDFVVHGAPFTELLYAEDFTGGTALEDFGWTAINGGTSADTWIRDGGWGGFGQGPTLSGYYNFVDIDSTFDESALSGPIDISSIDPHNILMLDFNLRYQPGHPVLDTYYPGLFGFRPSVLTVSVSTDEGENWVDVMTMADDDTLGGTGFVYNDYVSVNLTEFLGNKTIWLRFNFRAPDGYIFVCGFSEVMVYAGVSKPGILEVVDIPEDQGKQVHMAFRGSFNDLINWDVSIPVVRYDVWRGYEMEAPGAAAYNSLEDMVRNASVKLGDRVYTEDSHMIWDYVSSVPAKGMGIYGAVLPTLWDGMEATFVVIGRTEIPEIFAVSAPMGGTSEDNLAPSAPGPVVVSTVMDEAKNVLAWTEAYSSVDDIAGYNVYRSTDENAQGDLVTTTTALEYVDTAVEVEKQYYYTVTAVDFAGNESNGTKGSIITSVGKADVLPTAYKLDQNYPNPFNPTTTINFALPTASDVVLTVFNSNGQIVEKLYSGRMAAGYQKVNWNATTASAGIYFVQLKANDFQKTIKMTLVK